MRPSSLSSGTSKLESLNKYHRPKVPERPQTKVVWSKEWKFSPAKFDLPSASNSEWSTHRRLPCSAACVCRQFCIWPWPKKFRRWNHLTFLSTRENNPAWLNALKYEKNVWKVTKRRLRRRRSIRRWRNRVRRRPFFTHAILTSISSFSSLWSTIITDH